MIPPGRRVRARSSRIASATNPPMMRQYERLRQQLPADVLVFFRMGDFFELFGPDAIKGAPLLMSR